jgi:hypothetical protein
MHAGWFFNDVHDPAVPFGRRTHRIVVTEM